MYRLIDRHMPTLWDVHMQITLSWHLHVLRSARTSVTRGMSTCLHAFLSDNLGLLPLISTCLSVCLSAHMPVCPHAILFCLLVSELSSDRHCLSSPERQVLLALRWKANENWAFRLLSWLSKSFCQIVAGTTGWHSRGVLFNTSISRAQFWRMPSKRALMEKQTLRPIQVSERSHWLKI